MVVVAIIFAAVLSVMVIGFKPAIYLYTPEERKERLKLTVRGVITKRIPFRVGIRTITWDGLTLKNGRIRTGGRKYDYLFYETRNVVPKVGSAGWVLKRRDGVLYWNDAKVTKKELKAIFRGILAKYGLFKREIDDFIVYWLGKDAKLFFGRKDFGYGIYPVPPAEVERIYKIETELEYPEYIRVHFLVREIKDGLKLSQPVFPKITRSDYALHEWGVMKG